MKIKNPTKFVRSSAILIMLLYILISLFYNRSYAYKEYNYKTIIVSEGDTLWSIAKYVQENNDEYKNKDIRDIVYTIKDINNLEYSNLSIGQELKI